MKEEMEQKLAERSVWANERIASAQERMAISQEKRTEIILDLVKAFKPVFKIIVKEMIKSIERK